MCTLEAIYLRCTTVIMQLYNLYFSRSYCIKAMYVLMLCSMLYVEKPIDKLSTEQMYEFLCLYARGTMKFFI